MNVQPKSLNEITQEAIEILARELGIVATLRFLGQFTTGYGNYTEERDALFNDMSLEQVVAAIKKTGSS